MILALNIIIKLLVIGVSVLYFSRVLKPKNGYWRMLFSAGLIMAAFQAVYLIWPPCYVFSSDARPLLSAGMTALEAAFTILTLYAVTNSRIVEILLFYCLSLLISVVASLLLFALSAAFSSQSVSAVAATQWNDFFRSFIAAVLQMGLLIAAGEAISHYLRKQMAELRFSQFVPVLGTQAASAVILIVLMRESGLYSRMLPALAVLIVLYVIADAVLTSAFRAFVKNSELRHEVDALRQMQTLQKEYYLSLDAQFQNAQRMRHDYKNVLLTIDALLEKGETERARAFAADCQSKLASGGKAFYTGNEVLDAVLNNKAREAARRGARFQAELVLPEPLAVADVDLMSLFSNLLDNALEYVDTLPSGGERTVGVTGTVGTGLWALRFFNTYLELSPPDFLTTKDDKMRHGYGMGIVRAIVSAYNGTCNAAVSERQLTITVTLNTACEKRGG